MAKKECSIFFPSFLLLKTYFFAVKFPFELFIIVV